MEKMLPEDAAPGQWRVRATAWEFLALSLRYPDAVLAEAVATGEWLEAACEIAWALGLELPQDFGGGLVVEAAPAGAGARADGSEARLHALRAEATRLFIGAPEPVVSPYEGVHRAQMDGVQALLFVNPHSMEVECFMGACGLGRPAGTNEPLDHVATECELLEHLALRAAGAVPDAGAVPTAEAVSAASSDANAGAPDRPVPDGALPGGSPEAAYGRFLEEHTRAWMSGFAEAVAGQTREPLYRAAAQMLAAVVD